MVRGGVSVPYVILLSGCWADKSTRVPMILHAAAMADMQSTTSMGAKCWLAVRAQEAADRQGLRLSQETLRVARCPEICGLLSAEPLPRRGMKAGTRRR